jgi:hypothetical protein
MPANRTILILSNPDDGHVRRVIGKLKARGAEYVWFDPADFPAQSTVDVSYIRGGIAQILLHHADIQVDLKQVKAIWFRRPGAPRPAAEIKDRALRNWISSESAAALEGIWQTLDCLFIPGSLQNQYSAECKLHQLAVAAHLGFRIPRTLVTNRPDNLIRFFEECNGKVVSKAVMNPSVVWTGEIYGIHTRPVNRRDLLSYQSISHCPSIFQEYVPKRIELRITVVGTRVFAAEIHSQDSNATRDDWRHYDIDHTRHFKHLLPPEIEQQCIELVKLLRLTFGAIDMIITPDNQYVFLEINQNGEWTWIEDLTKLEISDSIAELLVLAS